MIRPISVWPYPEKAFKNPSEVLRGYISVEMSISTQMGQDIVLACKNEKPVYAHLTCKEIPSSEGIISYCKEVLSGSVEPAEVY
jgi:2-oxoglutarate ferredoxin oxidoreductase subunit alpha